MMAHLARWPYETNKNKGETKTMENATERPKDMTLAERLVKLFGKRVYLEWEEATDEYGQTKIIRPGSHKEAHYTGYVLQIGLDCDRDEEGKTILQKGDRVFFDRFCSPVRVDEGSKRYAWVNEYDILAKIPSREEIAIG